MDYIEIKSLKEVWMVPGNEIYKIFNEENAKLWAFAKGHYWEELMKLDLENDDNHDRFLVLHKCHELTRDLLELYFELYY